MLPARLRDKLEILYVSLAVLQQKADVSDNVTSPSDTRSLRPLYYKTYVESFISGHESFGSILLPSRPLTIRKTKEYYVQRAPSRITMSMLARAQPVIQTAQEELPAIQNALKQLFNVLKSIWSSVVESGLLSAIIDKIKALFGSATTAIESLPETVHQATEARAGGDNEAGVGGLVGDVVDNLQDKVDAAKDMLASVTGEASRALDAAETTPLLKTEDKS
ncbi:hypothetical protein FGB62_40g141 [Gracilaria domingensis]|nr:hypothetical protein FGB62_40g141 [Gracilaria domingensis]